jgi:hypothetical protein
MAFTAGFAIGPKTLGVDFTIKHTTAQHPVGTVAYDSKGRKWVYVKANGTIAVGNLVKAANADDPFTNVVIATASNANTRVLGMASLALSAGDYAWIVAAGIFEDDAQIVTASVAPGDPLISDANGDCTIAVETDINTTIGHCLVDDTDNTGTVFLNCF